MQISSGYEQRRARIELIPMIDVVFLLLVFFIYAMLAMVVHRGVPVELPTGSTARLDKRQHVSIALGADNTIHVDQKPVTLEQVAATVTRLRAKGEDVPVFIAGDKHADLGLAIQVLDKLRAAQIGEVMFEMERSEQ